MGKTKVCKICKKRKLQSKFCRIISKKYPIYYTDVCKKCTYARRKKQRQERKQKGICITCGKKSNNGFVVCLKCRKRHHKDNPTEIKYKQKLKNEVFNAYGGIKCACCGESYIEFLTIDHVNNDGIHHKSKAGYRFTGTHLYVWLKKHNYPSGFQVLCMNCNWAKGHYGKCPHQLRM